MSDLTLFTFDRPKYRWDTEATCIVEIASAWYHCFESVSFPQESVWKEPDFDFFLSWIPLT